MKLMFLKIEIPIQCPIDIPVTYVPGRNIVFLSFASGYAEYLDIDNIYIGVNSVDYSGYPDCRKNFIDNFEKLLICPQKRV